MLSKAGHPDDCSCEGCTAKAQGDLDMAKLDLRQCYLRKIVLLKGVLDAEEGLIRSGAGNPGSVVQAELALLDAEIDFLKWQKDG